MVTMHGNGARAETTTKKSTFSVKVGLAQMLRGGVIMDADGECGAGEGC